MNTSLVSITTSQNYTTKAVVTSKGKNLGESITYTDRKSYGVKHGLKGAELDRAHKEYRRTLGLDMNSAIAAIMTQGEAVAQRMTPTANGFTVAFIRPEKLVAKPVKVAALTEDEAMEALAKARGVTVEELEMLLA